MCSHCHGNRYIKTTRSRKNIMSIKVLTYVVHENMTFILEVHSDRYIQNELAVSFSSRPTCKYKVKITSVGLDCIN